MEECQRHISSREFVDWMAFDMLEPFSTRTTPDLLALLISMTANLYRTKGTRPVMPQDILPDPSQPRRLSAAEEMSRVGAIGADYRRLRAERLAQQES